MTTMTIEPIIKTAMNKIGLEERADDLLEMMDKIELDMNLAVSLEQADRGEGMSVDEVEKKVNERLKNGYYARNRK